MANASGNDSGGNSILDFIKDLVASIFGANDPDREKTRLLRELKKDLKRSRFYKMKGDLVTTALGKFFYEIYKVTGPAQVLLDKVVQSDVLKNVLIEHALTEEQKALLDGVKSESIKNRAKNEDLTTLKQDVRDELVKIYSIFEIETVKSINKLYMDLQLFKDFINFDYYFLLKKFDSMMPEQDFVYNPRFESINGEYVKEDLKDFLDVARLMNSKGDWDTLFDILEEYRNTSLISRADWKKQLNNVTEEVKNNSILSLIKVFDEDPYYKVTSESSNYEIVESYLTKLKNDAEASLKSIQADKKNRQIDALLKSVFGTTAISRTQYYTERENLTYNKKNLQGYIYVKPVNYLKAFFLDHYKSEVRQIVDLLLIQGKWSSSILSQQFSEAYHQLMAYSEELINFDNALADDANVGGRIKRLLRASARDNSALSALRTTLDEVNDQAKSIINLSAQNLIVIGKNLKQIMNDYKAQSGEMIINWKELDLKTDHNVYSMMAEIYKKIYYFIQLLQFCMKGTSE